MLIAALSLTLAAAGAEEARPESSRDWMLPALPESLEALDAHPEDDQSPRQFLTLLGREDLALSRWPKMYTGSDCPAERLMDGDALEALLDASETAQIIMINEAHNQPLHRPFIRDFGLALAHRGVAVFAAETFNHEVVSNMAGGHVPERIGFYTMEGSFARQVISLREAGYAFVAYETERTEDQSELSWADRIAIREEDQANHFIERVIEPGSDTRALVHVGHDHLNKRPVAIDEAEIHWFAARLWDKTGIEPLSIDQTRCASPDGEVRLYSNLDGGMENGGIDFYVAHPEVTFTEGRPDWRRETGDVDVPVPDGLTHPGLATVIEARAPDAPLDTLAIERLLLYPGETLPLLLPPGEWRLDAFTVDGRHGEAVTVQVE
ncbi:hypothetical protein FKB34_12595 [Glycocaulis profundi]|nr:hypothetical protein FKB34_12595 [Glycocaulis profundi]